MQHLNTLSLAFTINNAYAKQLSVVLASLCKYQLATTCYSIYVVAHGLRDATKTALRETLAQLNSRNSLEFIDISDEDYALIPKLGEVISSLRSGWSGEAILRLFLPKYLPALDRILYLDTDIVIMSDLSHLALLNLDNKAIAASADAAVAYQQAKVHWRLYRLACMDNQQDHAEVLRNLRSQAYINSGVMLMNLVFWRENQLGAQTLSLLQKLYQHADTLEQHLKAPATGYDGSKEMIFPDQDSINYLLLKTGKPLITYLPMVYNATLNFFSIDDQSVELTLKSLQSAQYVMKLALDDYVIDENLERNKLQIVHFAGTGSPWKMQGVDHPFGRVYRQLAKAVGWQLPYRKLLLKKQLRKLIKGLLPHAYMQHVAQSKGH